MSKDTGTSGLASLLTRRRSVRSYTTEALSVGALEALLWATQGVTGEGHRTCPSADARIPLTPTVVTTRVTGVAEGFCRWKPARGRLGAPTPGAVTAAMAAAGIGSQPLPSEHDPLVLVAVGVTAS